MEFRRVLFRSKVPVLEHPSVKQKALARQMRRSIIIACQNAVEEALENLEYDHG